MSGRGRAKTLPWVVLGLAVAVFVGWAAAPGSDFYTGVLPPNRMLRLAAVLKLVYLLAGAALRIRLPRPPGGRQPGPAGVVPPLPRRSSPCSPASSASPPSSSCRGETPFPSVADIYFVLVLPAPDRGLPRVPERVPRGGAPDRIVGGEGRHRGRGRHGGRRRRPADPAPGGRDRGGAPRAHPHRRLPGAGPRTARARSPCSSGSPSACGEATPARSGCSSWRFDASVRGRRLLRLLPVARARPTSTRSSTPRTSSPTA